MARDHAFRRALEHAPDVVAIARISGRSVEEVGRAFFQLGQALQLAWLEREIESLPVGTRLQRWALQAVRDDVLAGEIEPGKVFDVSMPLADVAEGYAAMDERRAIKVMLRP